MEVPQIVVGTDSDVDTETHADVIRENTYRQEQISVAQNGSTQHSQGKVSRGNLSRYERNSKSLPDVRRPNVLQRVREKVKDKGSKHFDNGLSTNLHNRKLSHLRTDGHTSPLPQNTLGSLKKRRLSYDPTMTGVPEVSSLGVHARSRRMSTMETDAGASADFMSLVTSRRPSARLRSARRTPVCIHFTWKFSHM